MKLCLRLQLETDFTSKCNASAMMNENIKKSKASKVCFDFGDAKLSADPHLVFNDMMHHAKTTTLFYVRFRRERAQ